MAVVSRVSGREEDWGPGSVHKRPSRSKPSNGRLLDSVSSAACDFKGDNAVLDAGQRTPFPHTLKIIQESFHLF